MRTISLKGGVLSFAGSVIIAFLLQRYSSGFRNISYEFVSLIGTFDFWMTGVGPSFARLAAAIMVAVPLSYGLAACTFFSRPFEKFISPVIYFSFSIPKVALYPLILVIFGIGSMAQTFLIFVGVFYLIFNSLTFFYRAIKSSEHAVLLRVNEVVSWKVIYYVLLKGSTLSLLNGLKSAFAYGLVLVVVSESTAARDGLGFLIWKAWDLYDIEKMLAVIMFISAVSFVVQWFFDRSIEACGREYQL